MSQIWISEDRAGLGLWIHVIADGPSFQASRKVTIEEAVNLRRELDRALSRMNIELIVGGGPNE